MCLTCAVPVRGRTLGTECLATALGPDAPVPEVPGRGPGSAGRSIALASFAVAAAATLLPWSRFGPGAEAFGAWTAGLSWSVLAGVAVVCGLLLCIARRLRPGLGRGWDVGTVVSGALAVGASALAIARPPAFSSPWLGPYLALVASAIATAASAAALTGAVEREPARS
jgi:asparagine N-glycosylation enzyme membrane subunit Stt3